MQKLYHYCSFDTFRSIIENKSIKFSDITKSNDRAEIIFLWSKYIEYIEKSSPNSAFLKADIRNQLKKTDFLVACFTGEADNLHMWTTYASKGISIGFDECKIREWANKISVYDNAVILKESTEASNEIVKFDKVTYFDKNQIKNYISKQCENIEFIDEPFSKIFCNAPFSKNSFWEIENEWRISISLIYSSNQIKIEPLKDVKIPKKLLMKSESKNGFQSCIYCCVPFQPEMITSITIAPNCNVTEAEIEKLLLINGFNPNTITIKNSIGTLR